MDFKGGRPIRGWMTRGAGHCVRLTFIAAALLLAGACAAEPGTPVPSPTVVAGDQPRIVWLSEQAVRERLDVLSQTESGDVGFAGPGDKPTPVATREPEPAVPLEDLRALCDAIGQAAMSGEGIATFMHGAPSDGPVLEASLCDPYYRRVTVQVLPVPDRGSPAMPVIVEGPTNGRVEVNQDGTVTYLPDTGYAGPDRFTYTVTDDEGSSVTATLEVRTAQ
jgi:hypothetical protein